MFTEKTAVILLNIGTPENPQVPAVRKYLFRFLNDKRVIDLPWFFRKILVNLIIVPFRAPRSAKLYQKLWTPKGSPLLIHCTSVQKKLQNRLGDNFTVKLGMSYSNPDIKSSLNEIFKQPVTRIIAFPLYPQYASSTTGSAMETILKELAKQYNIPALTSILYYHNHPAFIDAFFEKISKYNYLQYDHILMSYHGLPLSQINKTHPEKNCTDCNCTKETIPGNEYCYKASCYETSRLLAAKMGISEDNYTVCFQSRISKNWLTPFTDKTILNLANEGKKRILVICPAFTSDCLETTIEIGHEYHTLFLNNGGSELTLVESLNDSDQWVDAICKIIE